MASSPEAAEAALPAGLTVPQALELYRYVRLTRTLEERLARLFRQSRLVGGLFRSLGQEGESVAAAYALRRRTDATGDVVATLTRNLGSMLVMGVTLTELVRQYMARADSLTRGRDNTIHITDLDRGFIGQISPLGDMVPVMAGVALTFRIRREDRVGMVFLGEGATSTGAFHEGINFAAVQRCPLVVIVENNGYAYSTPVHLQTAAETFADKAVGYGVPGERVDGNDVIAVYEAARRAVDRARAGEGTSLLEVVTYRRLGHAMHDEQAYQPREEIERWAAENDPLDRYHARILEEGWATADELGEIDDQVAREVDAAVEEAEASPLPEPASAREDVYGGESARAPWTRLDPPDPSRA